MRKYVLVDDIDGSDADVTVEFMFENHNYTIDLSDKNHEAFVRAMTTWIASATPAAPGREVIHGRRNPARKQPNDPTQNRAVRDWAAKRGIKVPQRGRIRDDVRERFNAEAGR